MSRWQRFRLWLTPHVTRRYLYGFEARCGGDDSVCYPECRHHALLVKYGLASARLLRAKAGRG